MPSEDSFRAWIAGFRDPNPYAESVGVSVQRSAEPAADDGIVQLSMKAGRRFMDCEHTSYDRPGLLARSSLTAASG